MAASSDYISAIPDVFRSGETFKVELGWADYPASDWSAVFYMINSAAKKSITGVANSNDFRFLKDAANTAAYAAGDYKWIIEVTATIDGASEVYVVAQGTITIEADLATLATSAQRTHAKKVLESIEAVLENRASQDQSSYSIAGRSLSKTPITELLLLRDKYQAIVNREEREDRRNRGLTSPDQVWTRF